jgi:hypothetical protein
MDQYQQLMLQLQDQLMHLDQHQLLLNSHLAQYLKTHLYQVHIDQVIEIQIMELQHSTQQICTTQQWVLFH